MKYSSLNSEGETPDIDNPIYDLLINEEELGPASQRNYEDLMHIRSRIESLEYNHPHREALKDSVGSVLGDHLTLLSGSGDVCEAIDNLNRPGYDPEFVMLSWFSLAVGGAAVVAGGVIPGAAGPALFMAGAAPSLLGTVSVGRLAGSYMREGQEVKRLVDDYLEFSDSVHKAREDFDETWIRLIGDEDQDRLPEEE